MRQSKVETLFNKMTAGLVYRRTDLEKYSNAVDRHLQALVSSNRVLRLSAGLYTKPKESAFGALPPTDHELVSAFLKDDRFLITSFNNFTQLGLGLTQLYNNKIVYNYRRHGEFELSGQLFYFKRIPRFPKLLSREYLLIDMLNNLKNLAEESDLIVKSFFENKDKFDQKKIMSLSKLYSSAKTRKILEKAYSI